MMMISVVRDAFFRLIGSQTTFFMKTPSTVVASIATRKADARCMPEVFANSAMYACKRHKITICKVHKVKRLVNGWCAGDCEPGYLQSVTLIIPGKINKSRRNPAESDLTQIGACPFSWQVMQSTSTTMSLCASAWQSMHALDPVCSM